MWRTRVAAAHDGERREVAAGFLHSSSWKSRRVDLWPIHANVYSAAVAVRRSGDPLSTQDHIAVADHALKALARVTGFDG